MQKAYSPREEISRECGGDDCRGWAAFALSILKCIAKYKSAPSRVETVVVDETGMQQINDPLKVSSGPSACQPFDALHVSTSRQSASPINIPQTVSLFSFHFLLFFSDNPLLSSAFFGHLFASVQSSRCLRSSVFGQPPLFHYQPPSSFKRLAVTARATSIAWVHRVIDRDPGHFEGLEWPVFDFSHQVCNARLGARSLNRCLPATSKSLSTTSQSR
nr:hypothetical protein Iba_chr13aCG9900 [Ipomoea batatas]